MILPFPRAAADAESDLGLVPRAQQGDATARRDLFLRHAPAVASLLRRSFGPDVDVEEGVQETFLVAFEELGQLREAAAVRVWLLRIALRTCRRLWWTRRVRELLVPAGAEASPYWGEDDLGPGLDGDDRAAVVLLGRRLGALPLPVRQAVVVRHAFGFSLEETAEICGCSLATVKRRVAQAEQRLRGEES